jgi:hypothetical protein
MNRNMNVVIALLICNRKLMGPGSSAALTRGKTAPGPA